MIRALFALTLAALAATVLIIPVLEAPETEPVSAIDPPPVAVCPVEEGSGRSTTVGIASSVNGEGRLTAFAGGGPVGSTQFSTGASGSATVALADIAALGTAAGLVELPGPQSAAGSLLVGAESVAVESCVATPVQQTLLAGGATVSDEQYQIHLMNPYAGEALVDLIVQSESGLETAPTLVGISVPSRSSFLVDLSEVLPGRETLSITVEAVSGSVMASGRYGVGVDVALWHSVAPALDWYVPVPASGAAADLVISTGVSADVEYQLDVYGPEGVVEAFQEGVVPGRGVAVVSLGELGFEVASAMRVVSTQPVAVFLRTKTEAGVALTSGATAPASRWLLPAAGLAPGNTGSTVILNTGLDDATVVVTAHREQSAAEQYVVAAGTVLEVDPIEGNAAAYSVKSEGSLVALFVTTTPTGTAYSIGVPIPDE